MQTCNIEMSCIAATMCCGVAGIAPHRCSILCVATVNYQCCADGVVNGTIIPDRGVASWHGVVF